MTSPVGARAPAGDPFFRRLSRLPGSSSRTLVGLPGCPARPPHRLASTPRSPGSSAPFGPVPLPRLPGSTTSNVDALARFLRPVARSATPLQRPPVPPPRLPGSSSPAPHRLPREGSSARIRIILHRPRFRLVNPVGPSDPLGPPCGFPQLSDTVPRVPVGVRLPVRSTLCTRRLCWSTGFFCPHRVIHRLSGLTTEVFRSSTVRTQVVHR